MAQIKLSALSLGGGSVIGGDRGSAPAVRKEMKTGLLPDGAAAGAGSRGRLLGRLPAPAARLEELAVCGDIDCPGHGSAETLSVEVSLVPVYKIHDFFLHSSPPFNLLPEPPRHTGIWIDTPLAVQVALMADVFPFGPSLSPACGKILQPLFASVRTPW